jgi:hypothetical protein
MSFVSSNEVINQTYEDVRTLSFNQKRSSILSEHQINVFLDTVLDFKKALSKNTETITRLNDKFEEFTWRVNHEGLDDKCLMKINDIISIAKDLHSTLIRQYINMAKIRQKGIAKEEVKDFKYQIDVLKESYMDLESIYFNLPQMPSFSETTKLLSLIA